MRFTTFRSARARGNLALVLVAACLELVAPYVVVATAAAATTPPQVFSTIDGANRTRASAPPSSFPASLASNSSGNATRLHRRGVSQHAVSLARKCTLFHYHNKGYVQVDPKDRRVFLNLAKKSHKNDLIFKSVTYGKVTIQDPVSKHYVCLGHKHAVIRKRIRRSRCVFNEEKTGGPRLFDNFYIETPAGHRSAASGDTEASAGSGGRRRHRRTYLAFSSIRRGKKRLRKKRRSFLRMCEGSERPNVVPSERYREVEPAAPSQYDSSGVNGSTSLSGGAALLERKKHKKRKKKSHHKKHKKSSSASTSGDRPRRIRGT